MLNIEYKENLDEEFYKIIDDEFNKFAEKIRLFAIIHLFHLLLKMMKNLLE